MSARAADVAAVVLPPRPPPPDFVCTATLPCERPPRLFPFAERAFRPLPADLTGARSRITFARLPQDDPTRRCPDIEAARILLKWEPRVPLRQGLEKTIAYFDALLRGDAPAAVTRAPRLFPAGFT